MPIGKEKFHLCLSYDYDFVFLNTPTDRTSYLDHPVAETDIRFLKPTAKRFSSVNCTNLQAVGDVAPFNSFKPRHLGTLATNVTLPLLKHIADLATTTDEQAERLRDVIKTMTDCLRP